MMVQINCFTDWLTDKRYQVFFVAGAIAGDSRHCKASGTQQAKFEPAQNLILGSIEWSCAIRIYQGFNLSLIEGYHPPRSKTSTFMERSTNGNNLRKLYMGRPSCSKDCWNRSEISGKTARNDRKQKSINQWIYQNKHIFLPNKKIQ